MYRLPINHLQVLLKPRSIIASKCISTLARSQPPSAGLGLTWSRPPSAYQRYTVLASKCISKLTRSRPPSASLSYMITASKCISKLGLWWPPSASLSYSISASKCISKLARSRPPCASLSSTRPQTPSASLSPLNQCLQVLMQLCSSTVCNQISGMYIYRET